MPKNLRTELPMGMRSAKRRKAGLLELPKKKDSLEIRPSTFKEDIILPVSMQTAEDAGPSLLEIDTQSVKDVRRFAHARLSEHIRQMEDLADRFRMSGRLTSQLRCLGVLSGYAVKTGDRHKRLGAYYQSLDVMRLRVKKWGEHPENMEQRNQWRELEQRILALMLDLAERIDIKRRTLNKKTGGSPGNGRVGDPDVKPVQPAAADSPSAEEVPEPVEQNYEEMDDEALAALIPEEDR